jgi:hypothetical protein
LTTLKRAALVASACCVLIWLAAPAALLVLSPEAYGASAAAAVMLTLSVLAAVGSLRRNPGLVTWGAGPRCVIDPVVLIVISDLSYAWSCALFLADAAALLIALEALAWTGREGQGREGVSDGVAVRSFLLNIAKPVLAAIMALVASLAVAMFAFILDIGSSPLLVVAVAGAAAVISLAALLAWSSKTL